MTGHACHPTTVGTSDLTGRGRVRYHGRMTTTPAPINGWSRDALAARVGTRLADLGYTADRVRAMTSADVMVVVPTSHPLSDETLALVPGVVRAALDARARYAADPFDGLA